MSLALGVPVVIQVPRIMPALIVPTVRMVWGDALPAMIVPVVRGTRNAGLQNMMLVAIVIHRSYSSRHSSNLFYAAALLQVIDWSEMARRPSLLVIEGCRSNGIALGSKTDPLRRIPRREFVLQRLSWRNGQHTVHNPVVIPLEIYFYCKFYRF